MEGGGWLAIGIVKRPHGVKGRIRVAPLGKEIGVFGHLQEVLLGEAPERARAHRVLRVQQVKGSILLELEGLDLEAATAAAGLLLWVPRDHLPPLEEDEYYWQDLLGMEVVSNSGEVLGRVVSIMETGDSQALVCSGKHTELLIPFVHGIVLEVDPGLRRLLVDLPEGLE